MKKKDEVKSVSCLNTMICTRISPFTRASQTQVPGNFFIFKSSSVGDKSHYVYHS